MLTSASTSRTGRSILEPTVGESIVHFQDLRLISRIFPSESAETDLILVQIHITADQAVGPHLTERPALPQQRHLAVAATPPQINQPPPRPLLQVEFPVLREGPTVRGGLDSCCAFLPQGSDVLLGMPQQDLQVAMQKAEPDLRLPPAVVALDHGLEARLARGHEHRHYRQAQAQPDDPAQSVRVTMGAVEDHVVVKLSVAGQTECAPVLDQRGYRHLG